MNDPENTGAYLPGTTETSAGNGAPCEQPLRIGRYRVEKVLGKGGFGIVYLAQDEQLQRLVAIKVPHRHRLVTAEDAEAYLTEARTVAKLDHPNIVPVHDAGSTEQFPCFAVSKYINGTDLATKLKQDRLPLHEAMALVATLAEALHHAHKQGLVHRDIKPGNILLDSNGKPHLADFGLALKEENLGKGPAYAGTPSYMSPEQARGEGNRVDGRSDIFSLGVVFYELLTGRKPFQGQLSLDLQEQIISLEPRPPRQIDDTIPKELERICLKALAKQPSERYSTGKDLADDLNHSSGRNPTHFRLALQAKKLGCAFSVTLAGLLLAVSLFNSTHFLAPEKNLPASNKNGGIPAKRPILEVSRNPTGHYSYATIQQALLYAQPGDIIELTEDVHEENLVVDPSTNKVTNVTLQAAPGKAVRWTSAKKDDNAYLIYLWKAKDFHIKGQGITLDGILDQDRRVKDLVLMAGNSPGLTLEDLHCRGFGRTAVSFMNCMGTPEKPVRLLNLQTTTVPDEKPQAAIYFDANPKVFPPFNDFIDISDTCRFHGLDPKKAVSYKDKKVLGNNISWKFP
jgi:serine/threonine protein kinase